MISQAHVNAQYLWIIFQYAIMKFKFIKVRSHETSMLSTCLFSRCRCHQNGCKSHSKWYHWQQKKYVGECSHVTKFFSQKFRLKLLPPANEVSGRQCFYTCISFRSPPHTPDHTRHYYRNEVGARLYFHRRVWFCSQGGVCLSAYWDTPLRPGTPPGPGTHTPTPWTRHPSGPGTPPAAEHAGRYGQHAGGMHPTGMQSCFVLENRISVQMGPTHISPNKRTEINHLLINNFSLNFGLENFYPLRSVHT